MVIATDSRGEEEVESDTWVGSGPVSFTVFDISIWGTDLLGGSAISIEIGLSGGLGGSKGVNTKLLSQSVLDEVSGSTACA